MTCLYIFIMRMYKCREYFCRLFTRTDDFLLYKFDTQKFRQYSGRENYFQN